jgi:pentapeptide MXKDX repeat protein
MKNISLVLAAIATIAISAPAFAQDKMGDDGMKKPMMKHHHMMKKHTMHKKMMMKKDGM